MLNRPQFANPSILVAGRNFGCGSSREAAVWTLLAVGITCIVARQIADLYRENCLQNGVLPIELPDALAEDFERRVVAADGREPFTVDLRRRFITGPGGDDIVFDISDATAFGGNIQSSLRFDRKPDGTQVEMRLLASDVDGAQFGAAAGMKRLVPTGTGTVSIILKGPGKTWDSIMDNADGSISANFGQGTLTGLNLPSFLKRCKQGGFFPLDEVSNGTLAIDGAELKANISNGVARIDKAEAKSAKNRIWVSGIVPYAGGGLALSGGISQPGTVPAATQQPADGAQPADAPAATPANQVSFFVGGSWTTPFVSPINGSSAGN